ncbi:hypothetical protein SRHO_G00179330 [Serrasalmus rhombeus]
MSPMEAKAELLLYLGSKSSYRLRNPTWSTSRQLLVIEYNEVQPPFCDPSSLSVVCWKCIAFLESISKSHCLVVSKSPGSLTHERSTSA